MYYEKFLLMTTGSYRKRREEETRAMFLVCMYVYMYMYTKGITVFLFENGLENLSVLDTACLIY